MSEEQKDDQAEFVNLQEVDEVVAENENEDDVPMDEDDAREIGGEDATINQQGNIEIDLSNNSAAYFDQHTDSIFTITTHPTLPLAATGGGDNVTYLWTTHSSPTRLVGKLEGYTESVIASAFTASGKFLVTGDMTGKVLIHKAKKKGQVWEKSAEIQQVDEVSWINVHPKQDIFAFGATDGSVWAYEINEHSGDAELVLTGYSHSAECTAGQFYDVDNSLGELKLLTVSEDGSIIGWNCYTQQQIFKVDSTGMKGLSPSWVTLRVNENTGKVAAVGARDSNIAIINLETGTVVNMLSALKPDASEDAYDSSIEGIDWAPQLNLLAVGLVSGDVFIFDTHTWRIRKDLKCKDAVTGLQFIKGSQYLLASSMDSMMYKWDSRTGEVARAYMGHQMGILAFAIDCKNHIVTAGDEGVSLVFDI